MKPSRRQAALIGLICVSSAIPVPGIGQVVDPGGTRIPFTLRVVSAGGGIPEGVVVSLRAAEGVESDLFAANAEDGSLSAVLIPETAYELSVAAPSHRLQRFTFLTPVSGSVDRTVVLDVDPVVLPSLQATVQWNGTRGGGTRSVSAVRFADSPVSWRNLGEWLTTQPGLSVRGSALAGGQTLSVRGSRPEGVLVLLDGHPLNDPLTGSADLSSIPVSSLESATLIRGAGSAQHGSGALAGVLLLRSRQPRGSTGAAALRVSSFGGLGGDVFVSGAGEHGRAALSVAWDEVRNDFEFENRTDQTAPMETRVNADGSRLSAAMTAASAQVHVDARYDRLERGSPGPMGTTLYDRARWSSEMASVSAGGQIESARISIRTGWLGTRWSPGLGTGDAQHDAFDGGIVVSGRTGGVVDLLVDGRFYYETVKGSDFAVPPDRAFAGASASRSFELGAALLEAAVAMDGTSDEWALSPELGVGIGAGSGMRIRARAGQAFRLPTLADLYFAPAVRVRANPELEAERVKLDAELGVEGQWSTGETEVQANIGTWYRITDAPIVWLASAVSIWSPRNLDQLVSSGIEASFSASTTRSASSGWRLSAAAMLDRSRLDFDGNKNPMPYRPGTSGSLGIEHWRSGLTVRSLLRWTGARTTSVAGTRRLPGFLLVDVAIAKDLPFESLPVQVEGRIENLFDSRYELVELYPEPGRLYSLTIRLR